MQYVRRMSGRASLSARVSWVLTVHHEIPQKTVVLVKTISCMEHNIINIPEPRGPMCCSEYSLELVSSLTVSAKTDRDQRVIRLARAFRTPGRMCFAVGFTPPLEFEMPEHFIGTHALLSPAPPHRLIHHTAAMLSLGIGIGSPSASGPSPTSLSMAHAVTTLPSNSNCLIVTVVPLWSYHWAFGSWRIYCDGSSTFSVCVSSELLRDGREGRTPMAWHFPV